MLCTLRVWSFTMDSTSMNHYEKQLYTVFKTFDVDNEEALDKPAVLDLCDALQLEDRGATLVDTLFERRADRVTFSQFRNGLLTVLGGGEAPVPVPDASTPSTHIPREQPEHSDDDSSEREVAPKFVFGSKKYGRRSRPQHPTTATDEAPSPRAASDSRLDSDIKRARQRMRCKRSASAMENREENSITLVDDKTSSDLDHDRRIDCEQALALCRGLQMDGIDRRIVERIFEDTPSDGTTVGEFFDRLNMSLTTSIAATCDDAVSTSHDKIELENEDDANCSIATDIIVEEWERTGVQRPRRLLVELGFATNTLRLSDLERALDNELRALTAPLDEPRDARVLLLLARLTLSRLRLQNTRSRYDVAVAERDKLRIDLAEANRRAQLLAQDVDESHAHIEAELKMSLRQLEVRHAEATRVAAAEWASERERAATLRLQLESELTHRTELEVRLRADSDALRERNEELARRVSLAEDRAIEAERERDRLKAEIESAAGRKCRETLGPDRVVGDELDARLDELRLENKLLRDRNDELCAELEASLRRNGSSRLTLTGVEGASWCEEAAEATRGCRATRARDRSTEANLVLTHNHTEECDSSPVSIDQYFGHIEVVKKLQGIFEGFQKIPSITNQTCESCGTLMGIITSIQERVQELSDSVIVVDQSGVRLDAPDRLEVSVQTDVDADTDTVKGVHDDLHVLRTQSADTDRKNTDEIQRLSNLVKDLETSLEQMKFEYDKCEEYWSNKLDEEREIYNEEQRMSDERLTELIAKISEYERQFAPAAALPTIDEKCSLEVQFNDLEDEFAQYRRDTRRDLDAKLEEIARLNEKLEALERRALANGHRSPESDAGSPIGYLWNQGTIQAPRGDKRGVRDYHNPAYVPPAGPGAGAAGAAAAAGVAPGDGRSASDGERGALNPIRRPPPVRRSASAGALPPAPPAPPAPDDRPVMLNCSELEVHLRRQAQAQLQKGVAAGAGAGAGAGGAGAGAGGAGGASAGAQRCACAALAARCRQLCACVEALRGGAAREAAALRARVAHAEGAVARLQARLAAADLLVKDLYLENCQLAHHRRAL